MQIVNRDSKLWTHPQDKIKMPDQITFVIIFILYSLLSIPRISRDLAKYVELSVV